MKKKLLLISAALSSVLYAETTSNPFSQASFMPEMSLIVDTSLVKHSLKDEEMAHLEIPGVAHGLMGSHSHGEHAHSTYNASNGFNLNYAELALHSVADPYFELDGVFHLSEYGFEIEEAYFTTTSLPYNLRLRGGKFLSEFGRLNSQHHHSWDFADMALVYEAFLGSHGINEIGAQLQWIAPTPIYLMLGAEVLQGSNEQMFGREAIMIDEDIIAPSASAPSLVVAYAKSSFELTDTTTALLGASLAIGDARLDHLEDEEPHAFYGDSSLYGIDATLKHYFNSYSYLNWQSEWLYRELDGKQYNQAADIHVNMTKKQAGYYTQLIYAHNQNWRAGIRYDSIYKNDVTANATAKNLEDGFDKYSLMLDYTFSEFSRLRLQYNRNNAMFNEEGERQHIDTYIVQLNISIGAHGAHAF